MTERSHRISRRAALLGAGGAALLGLGATGLSRPAAAKAPLLGATVPSHYRVKLGAFECTTILDGSIQIPGPHPIFGQDQSKEDVDKLAEQNFLPTDKMEIVFTPVMVNTGSDLVLFDTGNGALRRGKGAGKLANALAGIGYRPEQVSVVVITHCHPDHIGGLMEGGKPLFPNARYVMSEAEYDFWSPPEQAEGRRARVGKLVQSNVVPLAEKFTFIKPEAEVVSGIHAVDAFGHTPGHMAFHIESGSSRLLLWADTTNHYVASLQRPDWHVRFDIDKEKAAATRKRILDMVASERIPATGYHMPFPAIGFVERKDSAYRWVPLSYQSQL